MTERQMTDKLRRIMTDLIRVDDGVYIFEKEGKFGTIKNYQEDEEHYQVMFDSLTREQVLSVFGKES